MKTAIVLFNLGGPDERRAIAPFRVNLFSDPAIIRAPAPIRFVLARLIAGRGQKKAEEGYARLGHRSPLLGHTQTQARALAAAWKAEHEQELGQAELFIAMRYWHPFAAKTARAVKAYAPSRILLLPLYPQFSATTTGSSLRDWHEAAARAGLAADTTTLCCWPDDAAYAAAIAALAAKARAAAEASLPPATPLRLLFSAHGLPEAIVAAGDPYQEQVERSVAAVLAALGAPRADHRICYQSRATPQAWIGPSTDEAITEAARDGVAVLVIPIAFVSEHIETLVELDVDYRALAERLRLPGYFRAPAPNADPDFIRALAALAARALHPAPPGASSAAPASGAASSTAFGTAFGADPRPAALCSHRGGRLCSSSRKDCPWHARA